MKQKVHCIVGCYQGYPVIQVSILVSPSINQLMSLIMSSFFFLLDFYREGKGERGEREGRREGEKEREISICCSIYFFMHLSFDSRTCPDQGLSGGNAWTRTFNPHEELPI